MAIVLDRIVALANQDLNGLNIIPYAQVSIISQSAGTAQLLYSDAQETPLANPAACDRLGQLVYYIEQGTYLVSISGQEPILRVVK